MDQGAIQCSRVPSWFYEVPHWGNSISAAKYCQKKKDPEVVFKVEKGKKTGWKWAEWEQDPTSVDQWN